MTNLKKIGRGFIAGALGVGLFALSNITIPAYLSLKIQDYNEKKIISRALIKNGDNPQETFLTSILQPETESVSQQTNQIPERNPKKLEEILGTNSKVSQPDLNLDENVLLGRLIPVKSTIEEYSDFYDVDPLWFTQILAAESFLFPLAYNPITKDYGIAQINKSRYEYSKELTLNPKSDYYSDENLVNNIYDPETNLISTLSLVKESMDEFKIKKENLEVLSAVYNEGTGGLLPNGEFNEGAKVYLNYIKQFKPRIEEIVQCFNLSKDEIEKINNPRTKELLEIYQSNLTPQEGYEKLSDFYISEVDKSITPENIWERAVTLKEAFYSTRVLQEIYHEDCTKDFEKIFSYSNKLNNYVKQYPQSEIYNYVNETHKEILNKLEDYKKNK